MQHLYIYDWASENSTIRFYGIDEYNKSVSVIVEDFLPYFYLELPDDVEWTRENLRRLNDTLDRNYFKQILPVRRECKKRQKLYYTHDDYTTCIIFYFTTNEQFRNLGYRLNQNIFVQEIGYVTLKVHENTVSPILQLVCVQDIQTTGWVEFEGELITEKKHTICDREYRVPFQTIQVCENNLSTPIPTVLSFDIEVYSSNPNRFPDAKYPGDCIFQISCIVWTGEKISKYLLSLGDPNPDMVGEDVILETYKHESNLLIGFSKLIVETNPQLITGWNILGFDIGYLIDRCEANLVNQFLYTGMTHGKCRIVEDSWTSSAYGQQNFRYLDMEGRIIIDLLSYARRELKFANYKLDTIAGHYLGSKKDPISVKDIFKSYEIGVLDDSKEGDELLAMVGKYCVQDSVLVQRLFDTFDTWINLTEMASVCMVPCSYLYTKGQQIKVFSQVYKYCYDNKILVEKGAYTPSGEEEFQGASVLQPVPGLYNYVVSFDFKSLYPTLIIAYNIDYTTYVVDDSIPDEFCNVIEWKSEEGKEFRYRFLKEPKGVLPSIVENLLNARTRTRNQIKELKKTTGNETFIGILDKRQLAFKVASNSMYGILGAVKGMLPLLPAAMSVTAMGRYSLNKAAQHLVSRYNCQIVYGDTDSCLVNFQDTPPEQLFRKCKQIQRNMMDEKIFPEPMELEFENIYDPFLILTKKRYMFKYFLEDGTHSKDIGSKGVILSRRDNSAFVRDLYRGLVDNIFNGWEKERIFNYITDACNKCCSVSVPSSEFIITKKVGDIGDYKIRELPTDEKKLEKRLKDLKCTAETYHTRALPAQIQLAERIRNRGTRVDVGERLEYLVTTKGGLKAKAFDKIEDPGYQKRYAHFIGVDYLYYIKLASKQIDELLLVSFKIENFTLNQHKLRVQKFKILQELRFYFSPTIVKEK